MISIQRTCLKVIPFLGLICLLIFFSTCQQNDLPISSSPPIAEVNEKYTLVWADEFNYTGLPDSTKWSYDVGDACDLPCGCGWGNNELQYYTKNRKENARVENGNLTIELRKEKMETRDYSSARLVTKNKGDWKYGRLEIRARMDRSLGTWAAIWMLPTDNEYGLWPGSGEIDIVEYVGWNPDTILTNAHTKAYNHMIGTDKGDGLEVKDAHTQFHDYIIEWEENEYNIYIDEEFVFKFENDGTGYEGWPFDKNFHLILNIAFGGNLGGKEGIDTNIESCKMDIDYVRVYAKNNQDQLGMKN